MEKEIYLTVMKNYKRLASNLISKIASYDWSADFCKKESIELYNKLINEFKDVDFLQFNEEELKKLDFQWFDENLICMPIWVVDCLKDGTEITSIDGTTIIFDKSKGLDKDVRFGITAYGFSRTQIRDNAINKILDDRGI